VIAAPHDAGERWQQEVGADEEADRTDERAQVDDRDHMSRLASSGVVIVSTSARIVLALKNRVPMNWTNAAHHSNLWGCHAQSRRRVRAGSTGSLMICTSSL
jgi:hypothetical protein